MKLKSANTLMKAAEELGAGYCVECGKKASGVEPDASKYTCESCGEAAVYGAEELLLMGLFK